MMIMDELRQQYLDWRHKKNSSQPFPVPLKKEIAKQSKTYPVGEISKKLGIRRDHIERWIQLYCRDMGTPEKTISFVPISVAAHNPTYCGKLPGQTELTLLRTDGSRLIIPVSSQVIESCLTKILLQGRDLS